MTSKRSGPVAFTVRAGACGGLDCGCDIGAVPGLAVHEYLAALVDRGSVAEQPRLRTG
jgi:hypothetical protein